MLELLVLHADVIGVILACLLTASPAGYGHHGHGSLEDNTRIGPTHPTLLILLVVALAISCADAATTGTGFLVDAPSDTNSGSDSDSGPIADDGSGVDGGSADTGPGDVAPVTCGNQTCAAGELCMTAPGCPVGPDPAPQCIPVPAGCGGSAPSCDCFTDDPCGGGCLTCGGLIGGQLSCACGCKCASPDTPIATPFGDIEIASLRAGDLVYSVHDEQIVAVPIKRTHRTQVSTHRVVRLLLANGRIVEMSPGHPTADGRSFGELAAGQRLDGLTIEHAALIPYEHAFTHDILPDSDTGTYFAAGALVGSTLMGP